MNRFFRACTGAKIQTRAYEFTHPSISIFSDFRPHRAFARIAPPVTSIWFELVRQVDIG